MVLATADTLILRGDGKQMAAYVPMDMATRQGASTIAEQGRLGYTVKLNPVRIGQVRHRTDCLSKSSVSQNAKQRWVERSEDVIHPSMTNLSHHPFKIAR
jgi:hypothetical protein